MVCSSSEFVPLFLVDAIVEVANQKINGNPKNPTDTQKCRYCNGAASLNLLPMSCGEAECHHILLGVSLPFPQLSNPLSKLSEESALIDHPSVD